MTDFVPGQCFYHISSPRGQQPYSLLIIIGVSEETGLLTMFYCGEGALLYVRTKVMNDHLVHGTWGIM